VVSPDPAEKLASYRRDQKLSFLMLSDPDLETIRSYGVLNHESGKIPHPTAIIVDRAGKVTYVRVDEDYRVRPPTAPELLPAIEASE
jgi:peroxiredoxin